MPSHPNMPDSAWTEVDRRLDEIEREDGVVVLFACESGSRAWGFPSRDSDFDVRFIYARPVDWYLSIDVETKRDVIERPLEGVWDVNGWDVRKALRLLRKSNPPLLEWLQSPIVYREVGTAASRLRALLPALFNPTAATYHYLHMARNNNREFLRGERVRQKKYFYVLRPLLACRWIARDLGIVPTEFGRLVDGVLDERDVRTAVDELLERKRAGQELDDEPPIPVLQQFIEAELARLEESGVVRQPLPKDLAQLSVVFRDVLNETWTRR